MMVRGRQHGLSTSANGRLQLKAALKFIDSRMAALWPKAICEEPLPGDPVSSIDFSLDKILQTGMQMVKVLACNANRDHWCSDLVSKPSCHSVDKQTRGVGCEEPQR
jgi:hypothetical protein